MHFTRRRTHCARANTIIVVVAKNSSSNYLSIITWLASFTINLMVNSMAMETRKNTQFYRVRLRRPPRRSQYRCEVFLPPWFILYIILIYTRIRRIHYTIHYLMPIYIYLPIFHFGIVVCCCTLFDDAASKHCAAYRRVKRQIACALHATAQPLPVPFVNICIYFFYREDWSPKN